MAAGGNRVRGPVGPRRSRRRVCAPDAVLQEKAVLPPVARLWLDWNETACHALLTIGLRTAMLASSCWLGGPFPAAEAARMVGEKQVAAMEALAAGWRVVARRPGHVDHLRLGAAWLGPYRRRIRANARRLAWPP